METRASAIISRRARSVLYVCAAIALLGVGLLGGRVSSSASNAPSKERIPLPAECEATWKQLKVSIESATDAIVSVARFSQTVPQYPNLIGFVEIANADKIDPSELRVYLDTAMARCYASASSAIPLDNQQLGRLLQLTLADIRKQSNPPVYATLDRDSIVLRYNQPL